MKTASSNKYQVPISSKDNKKINGVCQTQVQTQRLIDTKKIQNQNTKRIKIGSTLIQQQPTKIKLKKSRSPQIIKLMIEELQKQLQQKSKLTHNNNHNSQKSLKSTANSDIMKVKRKIKNQNQDGQKSISKLNIKSPSKVKKSKKNQAKQNIGQTFSPRNGNTASRPQTAKKVQKKKRTKVNLNFSASNQNLKSKVMQRKVQRQDFVILGDQFLELKNISAITQFQLSDTQQILGSSKCNKNTENCHGRWSSDIQNLPKHIQRSFLQDQKSTAHQIENQNDEFNLFVHLINHEEISKNFQTTKNSKNQVNKSINSIIKVQRWWREILKIKQIQKCKKVKIPIQIIQQQRPIEKREIIAVQSPKRQNTLSKSEKNIQSQHQDILKLRQNAANLQFKTHQQILIELLQSKKINQNDFQQKNLLIKKNLQKELAEIKSIKDILKDSAKKVEDIMKKTREDIKTIQRLSQNNKQSPNNIPQSDSLLTTLFGESIRKTSSHSSHRSTGNQNGKRQKGRYQKVKINVDHQIEEFLGEDQKQSIKKNKSGGICNSPNNELSQQSIQSQEQESQRIVFDEQDEDLQAEIYSGRINEASSGHSALSPLQNQNLQQIYKEYHIQEEMKKELELRIAKQLGMIPESLQAIEEKVGINTSIIGIHKFLINFFKFYLYYHKEDFLKFINMPFGQSVETRLNKNRYQDNRMALLNNWEQQIVYTEEDEQVIYGLRHIISNQIIEQFFQSYYEQTDIEFNDVERTNIQLQKIHNRAVFDSFNQNLNDFRPYFCINGPPYIWTNSEKALTFYFISQQNIQQVYEKTQMKVLKQASYLCGISTDKQHKKSVTYDKSVFKKSPFEQNQASSPFKILQNQSCEFGTKVSFQQYLYTYTQNFHNVYFSNLQDRLAKNQSIQVLQQNKQWFDNKFQEQKVNVLLDISSFIQETLFKQYAQILQNMLMSVPM